METELWIVAGKDTYRRATPSDEQRLIAGEGQGTIITPALGSEALMSWMAEHGFVRDGDLLKAVHQ